ncbi:MAG: MFS transporter, partial [Nitriliruptorales bacterium]
MAADGPDRTQGCRGRPWLVPGVVGAAVLALISGYGQFGVTAVLGDVADAFGEPGAGGDQAARVGLSATTLGIGLAIVRLAGLGSLPVASLADRHGRRLVLWLCAGGLLLTVTAATVPSFWTFVAVVALARPLLSGTNAVVGVIAAEETRTAERAKAVAVVEVGYAVGAGSVAIIHGIGSAALGFRGVLAIAAGFGLAFPWLVRRLGESPLFQR